MKNTDKINTLITKNYAWMKEAEAKYGSDNVFCMMELEEVKAIVDYTEQIKKFFKFLEDYSVNEGDIAFDKLLDKIKRLNL